MAPAIDNWLDACVHPRAVIEIEIDNQVPSTYSGNYIHAWPTDHKAIYQPPGTWYYALWDVRLRLWDIACVCGTNATEGCTATAAGLGSKNVRDITIFVTMFWTGGSADHSAMSSTFFIWRPESTQKLIITVSLVYKPCSPARKLSRRTKVFTTPGK